MTIVKGSIGNRNYTANWQLDTFTVTLNNQSATTAGTTSVEATYGNAMPSITIPTKTGYNFEGYYTATNGGGTKYYTSSGTSATNWNIQENTTLYAKWIDATPPICEYTKSNINKTGGVTVTPNCYDNETGIVSMSEPSSNNKSNVTITATNGVGLTTTKTVTISSKKQYRSRTITATCGTNSNCYDRDMSKESSAYTCNKCNGNCCNGSTTLWACKGYGCTYSYGDWTAWGDTKKTASSTLGVETRTVYY